MNSIPLGEGGSSWTVDGMLAFVFFNASKTAAGAGKDSWGSLTSWGELWSPESMLLP